MALKFTVHGVQSFIKGQRKSGVISIKHSRDITNRISPHIVCFLLVSATYSFWDYHYGKQTNSSAWICELHTNVLKSGPEATGKLLAMGKYNIMAKELSHSPPLHVVAACLHCKS